jgi:hypothetical protein
MPYTLCTKNLQGLTETYEIEESEAPSELTPEEADSYEEYRT